MRNFQEKKKSKRILESKPVLVFLSILVLVFAWNVFGFFGKMEETTKNKKIVEDKIVELQKEKEKLSSDIAALKTTEGLEESIRDKFGLVKAGEGMIVVVEDKNTPIVPKESKFSGFFSFFKNLFK